MEEFLIGKNSRFISSKFRGNYSTITMLCNEKKEETEEYICRKIIFLRNYFASVDLSTKLASNLIYCQTTIIFYLRISMYPYNISGCMGKTKTKFLKDLQEYLMSEADGADR